MSHVHAGRARVAQFTESSRIDHRLRESAVRIDPMSIFFIAAFSLLVLLGIVALALGSKKVGLGLLGIASFVALAFAAFLSLVARSNM